MKSTLLAAIFGIIGGVAMLLAAVPVAKIHSEWNWDGDAPLVPQIEEEIPVPEPLDHYSVAQAKTKIEKQAPRRHTNVARRPNFFERLLVVSSTSKNISRRNHLLNGLVQPRGAAE